MSLRNYLLNRTPYKNNRWMLYTGGGGGVDPRITAAITANATMLLMGDLANGTIPGNNTDPTSTWVDKINSNDATLTNFAWTAPSGWDDVVVPSGTQSMLKADGVDDYGVIADNVGLDPTGTEDFAICGVFKTGASLATAYLIAKNTDTTSNIQYGLLTLSDGRFGGYIQGSFKTFAISGTLTTNSIYSYKVKRISGVLTCSVNVVETYNVANVQTLITQPNLRLFARSLDASGTTHLNYLDGHLGYLAFFYNGATGLIEADVDTACALLRAPYF